MLFNIFSTYVPVNMRILKHLFEFTRQNNAMLKYIKNMDAFVQLCGGFWLFHSWLCAFLPVTSGASGVPGVQTRAVTSDDGGEAAGPVSLRGLQWGWSPQSSQVFVWTPQSTRWEGTFYTNCPITLPCGNNTSNKTGFLAFEKV